LGVLVNGFDEAQVERYAACMRENRPPVPVALTKRDGRLVCLDGHHRLAAAARCGFNAVPATVISP
jgi:ParB-like chromosome segregation protein Spo0J